MKVHYNKEDKVLIVQLVKKPVDHAYETENMLVHVCLLYTSPSPRD